MEMKYIGNIIMEKMKDAKLFALATLLTLTMAGCSNDIETEKQQNANIQNVVFDINVCNKPAFSGETRAYPNKTGWNEGDVIIMVIDEGSTKRRITYSEKGGWNTASFSSNDFHKISGNITAVYADNISSDGDEILTNGDVLYTENGTYVKAQNAIYINLPMEKRPLAKIKIKGVDDGLKLKATNFERLISLSPIKWADNNSVTAYDYEGNTATYFGLVPQNNGTTTIELFDENSGISYTRTFDKTMKPGDAIAIDGPKNSGTGVWQEITHVTDIQLNKSTVQLLIGEEAKLTATLLPSNATNKNISWKSSDNSIVTVTTGNSSNIARIKGVSNGSATITATAEDGIKTAICNITVGGDVEDFVKPYIKTASIMNFGGYVTASFGLDVTNGLANMIYLSNITVNNATTGELIKNYTITDGNIESQSSATFQINVSNVYCSNFVSHCFNSNIAMQLDILKQI